MLSIARVVIRASNRGGSLHPTEEITDESADLAQANGIKGEKKVWLKKWV
jgi:hypothetical protein